MRGSAADAESVARWNGVPGRLKKTLCQGPSDHAIPPKEGAPQHPKEVLPSIPSTPSIPKNNQTSPIIPSYPIPKSLRSPKSQKHRRVRPNASDAGDVGRLGEEAALWQWTLGRESVWHRLGFSRDKTWNAIRPRENRPENQAPAMLIRILRRLLAVSLFVANGMVPWSAIDCPVARLDISWIPWTCQRNWDKRRQSVDTHDSMTNQYSARVSSHAQDVQIMSDRCRWYQMVILNRRGFDQA